MIALFGVGREFLNRVHTYSEETTNALRELVVLQTLHSGVDTVAQGVIDGDAKAARTVLDGILPLYESLKGAGYAPPSGDDRFGLLLAQRVDRLDSALKNLESGQTLRAREVLENRQARKDTVLFEEAVNQTLSAQQRKVVRLQSLERQKVQRLDSIFMAVLGSCVVLVWLASALDQRILHRNIQLDKARERQRVLEQMEATTNTLVYLYDLRQRKNVFVSSALTPLLGWSVQQASSFGPLLMDKLIHPDDARSLNDNEGRSFSPKEVVVSEFRLLHADGSYRWFSARETVFDIDSKGNPVTVLGSAIDIHDKKEQDLNLASALERTKQINEALQEHERRLREEKDILARAAYTDALTGLPNQRALRDWLEVEFQVHRASGLPMVAVMLDLDDFKDVNDRFGHRTGDEVLRMVGTLLKQSVRSGDCAARYGGEEFAILCPSTDLHHGRMLAERLRLLIANHKVRGVSVSASFGVIEMDESMHDGNDLLERADRHLYAAKRLGKNRVCDQNGTVDSRFSVE